MLISLAAQAATEAGADDVFLMVGFILLGLVVVLIFIELVIPSGGLISLVAGILAIASMISFWRYSTTAGVAATLGYLVLGPVLIAFLFKLWIRSPMGRHLILGGRDEQFDSDSEEAEFYERARQERVSRQRDLVGARGVTITALRPVGMVKINNERLDALAETGVIQANTPVIVTEVYDNQIKVRPAESA